jgi:hypothetical protein
LEETLMDQKDIDKILRRHEEWLRSNADGERTVLIDADWRGLELRRQFVPCGSLARQF